VAKDEYKIIYVPVNDLEFDKENPRLPHSVVDSDKEEDVIDWMLKDASIIELMGSIGEKGFFPAEPLLVVKKGSSKKYTVVEGNRRLTAVKLLHNPKLATRRYSSIQILVNEADNIPPKLPVMVFPKRNEILDYLGFKHITGVKQWSALAKAKYLRELKQEYNSSNFSIDEQYKRLAKSIGSRADYVRDLLIGLDVYDNIHKKNYFSIAGLNEDTIEFGVYYNALKFANIPKFLGIDKNAENPTKALSQNKLEELTKILSEKDSDGKTKLGESRNLTRLNSIILEERPFQMFKKGKSLEEAAIYLEGPHEIFKNSVQKIDFLLNEADTALKEIPQCTSADKKLVSNVKEKITDLETHVSRKISGKKKAKP
jgi:hypothetical protein